MWDDMWGEVRERYTDDSFFRSQVQVAFIVGAIGLAYAVAEAFAVKRIGAPGG